MIMFQNSYIRYEVVLCSVIEYGIMPFQSQTAQINLLFPFLLLQFEDSGDVMACSIAEQSMSSHVFFNSFISQIQQYTIFHIYNFQSNK